MPSLATNGLRLPFNRFHSYFAQILVRGLAAAREVSCRIRPALATRTRIYMRFTNFGLTTLKEIPAEAEIVSHQLMLRAGLIRRLASGLFTWMPLGLRVLRKVEKIVREEMDRAGALELLMPAVQPAELWRESGRWDQYGNLLLRMRDRHDREFCFGPTHEEVITDIARRELRSYRQLPINFYQIHSFLHEF